MGFPAVRYNRTREFTIWRRQRVLLSLKRYCGWGLPVASVSLAAVMALGAGAAFAQDTAGDDAQSAAVSTSASSSAAQQGTEQDEAQDGWHTVGGHRYYVQDGSVCTGFFKVADAWYYAPKSNGYVVTGTYKYADGAYLLASQSGELRDKAGFVITNEYDAKGKERRYYLVELKEHPGIYVTKTGFFSKNTKNNSVGKYYYYGIPNKGYLARGAYQYAPGRTLMASTRTGHLGTKSGWVTTAYFTPGSTKHRYRMVRVTKKQPYCVAQTGFFKVKSKADKKTYSYFANPKKGYLVTSPYRYSKTVTLVANPKNGRLLNKKGWVTSSAYSSAKSKRTYRSVSIPGAKGFYGARVGLFKVGKHRYYGVPKKGYIYKNKTFKVSGTKWTANDKGQVHKTPVFYMDSTATLQGIDVSGWNADIDLRKVEADFVLIKATEGTSYENPYYITQAKQALSDGKLIGFYHFADGISKYASKAAKKKAAKREADYFIKAVNRKITVNKKQVDLIGRSVLVLDWEDSSGTYALEMGTSYAKCFLDRVRQKTGVTPMIYMSKNATREYNWKKVAKKYPLWCAQYASLDYRDYHAKGYTRGYIENPWTDNKSFGAWKSGPLMYQYMSCGRLKGYKGDLDMDTFYGDISDWEWWCKSSR